MPARTRQSTALPGLRGTARVDRRTRNLLPRLRPGDVAVIDQVDLDRATAQAFVDAGVVAVINAAPMISGRYPNLGPDVLAKAGVAMLDGIGAPGLSAIRDGAALRLHDGGVYVGDDEVATGRLVDDLIVKEELAAARGGLVAQLESFTHNSTEFLRREQDLLLHGTGIPRPATTIADRPVVVVVPGDHHAAELAGVRRFIREQNPVLIGVDTGADALLAAGHKPDIVVVSGRRDEDDGPSAKALRAARDVVVQVDRGAGRSATDRWDRLGVRPLRFESGATTEDAALLLADSGNASVIVGVGMHATLDEFLDRQRTGLASTYLTRLKVGPRLVDATAVPTLYSGRVRPRHVFWVLLAGLVALAAAIGTTPVGQEWADSVLAAGSDLIDYLQGLRS
ncbi:putative cytokinetic ring protein SteA [Nocardioides sp. LHG3406-4]|uniref:putative cytokinetic ring protein SteA n=1 Tax=Nocardioides sp. LHG3406-4 TaxID=2804575 RepID=UPI003CF1221F